MLININTVKQIDMQLEISLKLCYIFNEGSF